MLTKLHELVDAMKAHGDKPEPAPEGDVQPDAEHVANKAQIDAEEDRYEKEQMALYERLGIKF